MSDAEARLLAELRLLANRNIRVDYSTLCIAFGKIFPAVTGLEQRRRLHTLLQSLAAAESISLPVGKPHYDRSTDPPMPHWLNLMGQRKQPAQSALDPATFPWVPELRFTAELRNLQQLDVLRRVHEFLASGGAARCMVPVKERSVELFGDEKKLDDLRGGALFRSGRLSLGLLRCFQVSPPLVWERGPSVTPQPIIIIENHSTWHSFVRCNKDTGKWAAVCYGSGDCFESSAPSLAEVVKQSLWDGSLLYFGDLDPKGLLIPQRAMQAAVTSGLPSIEPARAYYELLLNRAKIVALPVGERMVLTAESETWLGASFSEGVQAWFEKGVRIPQELVGYEQL